MAPEEVASEHTAKPVSTSAGPTCSLGWLLRAVMTAHLIAGFLQPVFAGVYLSGRFDGLAWHGAGANLLSYLGYGQIVLAAGVWIMAGTAWPTVVSVALAGAEWIQYTAGMSGGLWLHIPLGVAIIAALVLCTSGIWLRPLPRRARPSRTRARGTGSEASHDPGRSSDG